MTIIDRNKKLAIIHIAKKQLALTDDQYRALLFGACNLGSASEIKTEAQYRSVMTAFKNAGYKAKPGKKKLSDKKLAKCYALWCSLYEIGAVNSKAYGSMMKWIAGRTGGTNPSFLRDDQKSKMIEELKSWHTRVERKRD